MSEPKTISITADFSFELPFESDVLLQFEAAAIPEQEIISAETVLPQAPYIARVAAEDAIGERIWLRGSGPLAVSYRAQVAVNRLLHDLSALAALPPHSLPGGAVPYLFDSRYCQGSQFVAFTSEAFGHLHGGAKVVAMRDWIAANLAYTPGSSTPETTAVDTFHALQGVCRDYAHLLIALARAAAIPARFVSCFAPGVKPQDFHAVAEVFLADPTVPGGGAWHVVDATGMADAAHAVKIGVGRDAADVSFLTSFGPTTYNGHTISVFVQD